MTADGHRAPLAPGGRLLLGHAVPMLRDRLAFLQDLRAAGPIVRITAGPKTLTVVNSPDLIQEMLTSKSHQFTKGALFEKLKLFGSSALPVAEGEPHLRRRRLMQPAFHREQVSRYVTAMRGIVEPHVAAWEPGTPLDLKTEMQLMAQNVVMDVAFSSRPGPHRARAILTGVDTVFTAALRRALLPVPALHRLPTRRNRDVTRAGTLLREEVSDIITAHRARPDAYDDVVSLLLAARDDHGTALPDDEIIAEVTGLLAAGSETTAVALSWLFHELGHHPHLERRLHDELATVLDGQPLTAAHLPRLDLTRRLLTETLRLHSPAWLVTRRATQNVRLGTITMPAGTDVIWSPYTLHRDPALYTDPLRFDPDRWLPDRPPVPKNAFIPFGAGKRQCMGDAFAWAESTVITALIASRWRLRPAPGAAPRPVGAITVHPSSLRMTAEPRQRAHREAR